MQLTAGKKDDFNIAAIPAAIQLGREQRYWNEQRCCTLSWPSADPTSPTECRICHISAT